jgi:hypothetical protein
MTIYRYTDIFLFKNHFAPAKPQGENDQGKYKTLYVSREIWVKIVIWLEISFHFPYFVLALRRAFVCMARRSEAATN